MKEREAWCFCPPQAQSDRIQCHGVIAMFVSSLHVIAAGVEGTLVGSDQKSPFRNNPHFSASDPCLYTVTAPRPLLTLSLPLYVCRSFSLRLPLCQQSSISLPHASAQARPRCWVSPLLSLHCSPDA